MRRLAFDADQLEAELSAAVPEAHQARADEVTAETVAAALPCDAALVEILAYRPCAFDPAQLEEWGPWRYTAFTLTSAGEDVAMVDLGPASEVDEIVADVLDTMSGRPSRDIAAPDGYTSATDPSMTRAVELRATVLDPLLPFVGGARHLVFAPDGNLSRLPFAVLPTTPGSYLIDDYRVSYVGVGRDLLRARARRDGGPGPPLVVAAPDFDLHDVETDVAADDRPLESGARDLARAGVRFSPLQGALTEGMAIADMLGVEPLVGSAALEGRVLNARSPVVLHLATHGWFLPPAPAAATDRSMQRLGAYAGNPLLRSGLALAGANRRLDGLALPRDAGDGLLHAADVLAMDLVDTELVVLSACDTGLGDVHNGEGVFGLRRAFQEAGARTLVMSLWKVPDAATKELMLGFYRRVLEGDACVDALHDAQVEVRRRHPHPSNWGAFICQGHALRLSIVHESGEP